MKKSLLALLVLTLVVLGSLTWLKGTSSPPPLERDMIAASDIDPASLQGPGSVGRLNRPAQTVKSDSRTALAGEAMSPAPEEVAVVAPLESGSVRVLCLEVQSAIPVVGMFVELMHKNGSVVSFGSPLARRTNERGEAFFDDVKPRARVAILTRFGGAGGRNVATAEVRAGETAVV